MFHFHIPTEGIGAIIRMWRDERAVSQASVFSDPVQARRDRVWRRVLAVLITLGFVGMLVLPVWLFVKMFSIGPPTPEQIQQRREQMSHRRAAARPATAETNSPGGKSAPNQP